MRPKTIQKVHPGVRFGNWTVLARLPWDGKCSRALCRCDCGTERAVLNGSLTGGSSTRCDFCGPRRHGFAQSYVSTSEFSIWAALRERCYNPNCKLYPNYGGRGIAIAPEWSRFPQFLADMGPRPSADHSLDRIDNDGPYSPSNCRWATRAEQARNMRTNLWIEYDGRRQVLSDWACELGIPTETLRSRIVNRKWSVEKALTHPHDLLGESHFAAKLTDSAVRDIRSSRLTGVALAAKYNVSPQLICDVRKRKIWKHVE